jgi:hypothetical protein
LSALLGERLLVRAALPADPSAVDLRLEKPASPRQNMPAALLLPGSGPTDRNGDQPPALTPHTLTKIADVLADEGVASLRFDKYGTGRTGLGAYAEQPTTIDYPAFVRQAGAAYQLLADRPEVDRRALFLIGHSEGALTALQVAASTTPAVSGIALLQPLAERFLDVLARQLRAQLAAATAAGQMTPEQQRTIGHTIEEAVIGLRTQRAIDTTGMPPPLAELFQALDGPSRRFAQSIDAVDPAALVHRLPPRTSVLLTCGTADQQVPCDTTTTLAAALDTAHTPGPGHVVLPGVDHVLADPAHPQALSPAAIGALHRLVRQSRR